MKPYVICHMITSLDGRLHPSGWTRSPDGSHSEWSALYERIHQALEPDAWLVGRVTMGELSRAAAHPPAVGGVPVRPNHFPARDAGSYAIALDPAGRLHFDGPTVGGDAAVVLLGADVPDSHLAELAADGVAYVVSEGSRIDLAAALEILDRDLGIKRLLLEGGAKANGAFLAAGLVDEVSLILTPAIDGRPDIEAIFDAGAAGLTGKVELSLISCEAAGHGAIHLRYAVKSA